MMHEIRQLETYQHLISIRMNKVLRRLGTGVKGRNKRTRFPGICEDAKALGVSRSHLYFVLTGQRKSPRIEEYYRKKGVEV
jgi:hypothetical protein